MHSLTEWFTNCKSTDVVEIQFNKPSFKYKAGQWLFLQVPSVSKYQWHPFTITSCPYDPYVSVHVRQVGDFTRDLGDAVGAGGAQAKLYEGVDPMGMYEVALQNGQAMPVCASTGLMVPRLRTYSRTKSRFLSVQVSV